MKDTFIDLKIVSIKWYSIFMLVSIILGYYIMEKEAVKKGLDKELFLDMAFYTIICGLVGARIYYIIFNMPYYLNNPKEIFMIWHGGLAIHGAIIGSLTFLIYYTKKYKVKLWLLLDIIVVGLIIAQALGRWGNFFNQEAYGRIVSLSFLKKLYLPKFIINGMYINNSYREPTFLYESVMSILGFIALIILRKSKKISISQLTGVYLIWYGTERLIIETFRADSLMLGFIKMAQLVSVIYIIIGIILIIMNIKSNKKYYKEKFVD